MCMDNSEYSIYEKMQEWKDEKEIKNEPNQWWRKMEMNPY